MQYTTPARQNVQHAALARQDIQHAAPARHVLGPTVITAQTRLVLEPTEMIVAAVQERELPPAITGDDEAQGYN
jgi:hypothetical protein